MTKKRFLKAWRRDRYLYIMCVPTIIFIGLFKFGPMYGLQLAFKDYKIMDGIWGSEWVGFEHFIKFLNYPQFWTILGNTIGLSLYNLATFPISIILALFLNQVRNKGHKRFMQTALYLPHFISLTVICGMVVMFTSPSIGIINTLMELVGIAPINFMGSPDYFPHVYVWSGVWQNAGWGTIVYLAALSAIDESLYEAATLDGANKWHIIRYIDIPSISPTIVTLFILRVGSIMQVGFQKVWLLQNPANMEAAQTISTYVYQAGLLGGQFSYSTAIGLFNNVVDVMMLLMASYLSKKLTNTTLLDG